MKDESAALDCIWIDGRVGGGIPGDDPGILLGLTVFETLRTYGAVPFRLAAHLDRLHASALALDIALPPRAQIEGEILAACADDVYLRYTLTAGGHRILQRKSIDASGVGRTMRVARMPWENPASLPGAVKHGCRAAWILAARQHGVDEVLLVDPQDQILEANRSSVVAVVDGVLCTPPLDGRQLAGVTREALLDAGRLVGLTIRECSISSRAAFDELYLASTLKELSPVVEIDGVPGPGPGPLGEHLHAAFRELVDRETNGA
ncbi:MAG: aminotransferase class IV [Myxococcota bacterium]|nr:aminotransferase class IV [Myxococcota bacterium]